MIDSFIPTLALSGGEIVSILIAIGVILSGIFGQANEAKKAQQKRQAGRRGDGETGSVTGLDEIAQRRRQQLEALAKARRGGTSTRAQSGAMPASGVSNRASERATAKAQYDAKEVSKRELGEVNSMLAWGESGGTAQAGADAERAAMLLRRQAKQDESNRRGQGQLDPGEELAEAQRKAQRQSQRQRLALQQQRAAQARPKRQPIVLEEVEGPRRAPLSEDGRGTPASEAFVHQSAYDTVAVDRAVPDNVTTPGAAHTSRMAGIIKGRSWREVIMLKEILDPPVSMRE